VGSGLGENEWQGGPTGRTEWLVIYIDLAKRLKNVCLAACRCPPRYTEREREIEM